MELSQIPATVQPPDLLVYMTGLVSRHSAALAHKLRSAVTRLAAEHGLVDHDVLQALDLNQLYEHGHEALRVSEYPEDVTSAIREALGSARVAMWDALGLLDGR